MSILIPLLNLEGKKLDTGLLKSCLIKNGRSTAIASNLQLFSFGVYRDRPKNSVYELTSEIDFETGKKERKNGRYVSIFSRVVIGQSGAFLLADDKSPYTEINNAINALKPFIELCELCKFKPFAVAHISDGDFYLSEDDYYREIRNPLYECEVLNEDGEPNA